MSFYILYYIIIAKEPNQQVSDIGGQNAVQLFGASSDMKKFIDFSKIFVEAHRREKVTFIGHSKGGAEAAAGAVAYQ